MRAATRSRTVETLVAAESIATSVFGRLSAPALVAIVRHAKHVMASGRTWAAYGVLVEALRRLNEYEGPAAVPDEQFDLSTKVPARFSEISDAAELVAGRCLLYAGQLTKVRHDMRVVVHSGTSHRVVSARPCALLRL